MGDEGSVKLDGTLLSPALVVIPQPNNPNATSPDPIRSTIRIKNIMIHHLLLNHASYRSGPVRSVTVCYGPVRPDP